MKNLKKRVLQGISNVQDKSFIMASTNSTYESLVSKAKALEELSEISVSSQTKNLYRRNIARKTMKSLQMDSKASISPDGPRFSIVESSKFRIPSYNNSVSLSVHMDKSIAKAAPHLSFTIRRRDGGRQAVPSTQDILSSARDQILSPRGSLSDFKP